jgi:hypothetical protein
MGICKYCGQDAGFLRHVHPQCEAQHQEQLRTNAEMARLHEVAITEAASLVMSYAERQIDHPSLIAKLRDLAKQQSIAPTEMHEIFIRGWEKAVDDILANGIISAEQESQLKALQTEARLTQEELDTHGAFMKAAKSSVLRSVMEGHRRKDIDFDGFNVNLQKAEYLVWVFSGVDYLEERIHRQYDGGYGGFSIRVASGLYFHTGAFRGRPIDSTSLDPVDRGKLGITNVGIYFTGAVKVFRLPYKKIVAFEPFSDAIKITKDAASAKPQVFSIDDPWFAFNLMKNLAAIPN